MTTSFHFHENSLFNNRTLVIAQVSANNYVMVRPTKLTNEEQGKLDDIIFKLRSKKATIRYIDDFSMEFNPDTVVQAFIDSTDPKFIKDFVTEKGIELTPEELTASIDYQKAETAYKVAKRTFTTLQTSIRAKVAEKVKRPSLPYAHASSLNIDKLFGKLADQARAWLNNEELEDPYELRQVASSNRSKANLLRVSSNGRRINALSNYDIGVTTAKNIYGFAMAYWQDSTQRNQKGFKINTYDSYTITVNDDSISIGCQAVPRAEVERIAALLKWDVTPTTAT